MNFELIRRTLNKLSLEQGVFALVSYVENLHERLQKIENQKSNHLNLGCIDEPKEINTYSNNTYSDVVTPNKTKITIDEVDEKVSANDFKGLSYSKFEAKVIEIKLNEIYVELSGFFVRDGICTGFIDGFTHVHKEKDIEAYDKKLRDGEAARLIMKAYR